MTENQNLTVPPTVMDGLLKEQQEDLNRKYELDMAQQKAEENQRNAQPETEAAGSSVHEQPGEDDCGVTLATQSLDPNGEGPKKTSFLARFLGKRASEYETELAAENNKVFVRNHFAGLQLNLQTQRERLAALKQEAKVYAGLDIATGAFEAMQISGRNLADVFLSPGVQAQVLTKTYVPMVLELHEAHVAKIEKEFAAFKKENSAILKAEGLI